MTDPAASPSVDPPHPMQGEWRRAQPSRWGGHVSPQFLIALLIIHLAALGWFCADWDRVRLLLFDFAESEYESDVGAAPDVLAARWRYTQDPPGDLAVFRTIAAPLVAGIPDATARARVLANYIYGLRGPVINVFDEDVRFGPDFLLDRMKKGLHANCGQMSTVLASLWRSVGGDSRAVRWGTTSGTIGHYAMELWDPERRRWFYYDMNLNGFGVDDDGVTPLSVSSLRSGFLTGEDLHLQSNPAARDFSETDLATIIRAYPVEWYVLNNTYLDWSPANRFGRLNRFRSTLSALPHPFDRVLDNMTGARDRRLVVRGRITIDNLFTFRGARMFVGWLLFVITACGLTLARRRPIQAGPSGPAFAGSEDPAS
jgi:hypothetical protein